MAGRNSIQILRGAESYDPSVREDILLDGQPFYSKKTKQLYIGDGISPIKQLKGIQIDLNLANGEGTGSLQQVTFENDVENPKATGLGSIAFGGIRYNYLKYKESYFIDTQHWDGALYKNADTNLWSLDITDLTNNIKYDFSEKVLSTTNPNSIVTDSNETIQITFPESLSYVDIRIGDIAITLTLSPYYNSQPTSAEGNQAMAAGGSTHAFGDWSFAMGHNNKIYGKSGAVFGGGNRVGQETTNTNYSFNLVAGETNNVIGRSNAVFGANNGTEDTPIHGNYNLIAGQSNKSTNIASYNNVILGSNNEISNGHDSFVSGNSNTVTSSHAFASGISNTVSGGRAVSLGELNTVTGNNSTAINYANKAYGYGSFVFGGGNSVAAGTNYSAAGGTASTVKASYSFAFGQGLSAGYANQFIIGKYNANLEDSLFEIGNGEAGSGKQKNAFAIFRDGRAKVYGAPEDDNDVVRLEELNSVADKLVYATDEDIDALWA